MLGQEGEAERDPFELGTAEDVQRRKEVPSGHPAPKQRLSGSRGWLVTPPSLGGKGDCRPTWLQTAKVHAQGCPVPTSEGAALTLIGPC